MEYKDSYMPVDPDFRDVLDSVMKESRSGKVHYFGPDNEVASMDGQISGVASDDTGDYVVIGDGRIRMDKIITVYGKPGPAYDEYDSYANMCLSCTDFGQF